MPASTRNIDAKELKDVLDPESVLEFIGYENSSPAVKGNHVRDCCPIHQGENPTSLSINSKTHLFKCHSCGEEGDLIALYMKAVGCTFQETLQQLAERFLFNSNSPKKIPPRPPLKKEKAAPELPPINTHHLWVNAKESGDHPYLSRKKVVACVGLRYGEDQKDNKAVVVPFYNVSGDLQTLQFINDNMPPLRNKFFLTGYRQAGAFFPIGKPQDGEELIVGEGLATCLTLHEALEGAVTVISAGSAGNIPAVVEAIRGKYPRIKIKLAIDADNAGRVGLDKISPPFKYAEPSFDGLQIPEGEKCKDFNDLVSVCGLGLEDVKKQFTENEKTKEGEMTTTQKENDSLQSSNSFEATLSKILSFPELAQVAHLAPFRC